MDHPTKTNSGHVFYVSLKEDVTSAVTRFAEPAAFLWAHRGWTSAVFVTACALTWLFGAR